MPLAAAPDTDRRRRLRPRAPRRPERGAPSTSAASTPSLIGQSSALRTTPRDAVEPRPGHVGVDAGEERDDRHLGVSVSGVERRLDLVRACSGRVRDDPPHARAQLVVRRDDVDHQVPEGLPEPDHRDRRDHVEHELLRRAGLEPRRARDHLGPDDDRDLVLGEPRRARSPSTETSATVSAPACRAAASAPTTYGVRPLALSPTTASRGPTPSSPISRRAVGLVVLGVLLGRRCAGRAAGDRARRRDPAEPANVDSHSAASTRASLPDVPAPT